MLVKPVLPNAAGALRPNGPNRLEPEHVSGAPAQRRQSGRDVRPQPPALLRRGAQCLRLHHPHAVEFTSAAQDLGEAGQLVGGRDECWTTARTPVRNRGVFENGMISVHRAADRHLERLRDRRGQRLAGGVARRHQRNVVLGDAVVRPPEAERVEDLGGENLADVLAGGGRDDLAHQRAPRQPVVDVHQARPVDRLQFAEHLAGVLAVVHAVEVRPRPGGERHARAVGHHVPDRGAVLAVAGVGGQVVADPVVEREDAAFDEHVHDGRGDRLGRGVHAERRFRCDRQPFRRRADRRARCPSRARWPGSARPCRCAAGTAGSRGCMPA